MVVAVFADVSFLYCFGVPSAENGVLDVVPYSLLGASENLLFTSTSDNEEKKRETGVTTVQLRVPAHQQVTTPAGFHECRSRSPVYSLCIYLRGMKLSSRFTAIRKFLPSRPLKEWLRFRTLALRASCGYSEGGVVKPEREKIGRQM